MKLMGTVLILLGAVYGYLVYRRSAMRIPELLRSLADDLPLLRCKICVHRYSLPAVLTEDLGHGISGVYVWLPLAQRLAQKQNSFSACWEQTMDELPILVAQRLAPLGKVLPVGGDTLSKAIEEIHRELHQLAREQEERQRVKLRLSAAVSFSAAALLILIFV